MSVNVGVSMVYENMLGLLKRDGPGRQGPGLLQGFAVHTRFIRGLHLSVNDVGAGQELGKSPVCWVAKGRGEGGAWWAAVTGRSYV